MADEPTISGALDDTASDSGLPAESAEASGLPQLDFSTFDNQIFWLVVTLLAIYFILSRIALPRIASVLAERRGTITNDIAKADELKKAAVEAEENYKKALADARAEAQKIVAETKAEIQADLDAAMKDADAEIAARAAESEKAISEIRATAVDNVRAVAKDTAAELVAVLGGKADAAAIDAAVAQRMKG
ncbi:F0F1 ATP synthase subunit B' [Pseudaestuariivita sp.]|uniref:F0F1 ATP synthase subunit B' n=1 Tax=Pseudaestuariivita sp. TaxID=2211669 RepID=UPI004059DB22